MMKFIRVLVAISYLLVVLVNFLANYLPINNQTTGAVSESYPDLFAPAGLTFSIWGLIYLLLGFYVLYQFGVFGKVKRSLMDKVGFYFIISSLANTFWIFSWHYNQILLSVMFMITLLYSLIKITSVVFRKDKVLSNVFGVYFGWITVALVANVTAYLVSIGWKGFGISDSVWTVIMLIVAGLIAIITGLHFKNIPYLLVLVWAYAGIVYKHVKVFNGEYFSVILTASASILIFILTIIFIAFKK